MAGSPRGAWVGVRVGISTMRVWISMGKALLICRGFMVALVLVVSLIEGPVALQAVPGRRPTPAATVRGPGRAVDG